MNAWVVGVGDELLQGIVVNSNAAMIGRRLQQEGIAVSRMIAVGDVTGDIVAVLHEAAASAGVVIVTGGLGPTPDDRTREALAELLGSALVRRDELVDAIRERMERFGREMAASNLRQADIPEAASAIPNPLGTAPGIRAQVGSTLLYSIPGVPYEAEQMLEESILPELRGRPGRIDIRTLDLRCVGIPESELAELLADLADAANPQMEFLPSGAVIRLRFIATGSGASGALGEAERVVRERCGTSIFGAGDETMEQVVGRLLTERKLTIATAESCTGGLVAARLVSVPGASAYVRGGVVAYQDDVKAKALGISQPLIEAAGAVSGEVALEMARGARIALDADVGVSVSCAAGPLPSGSVSPGVTFVAVAGPTRSAEAVRELRLPGERDLVRDLAATHALNMVRLCLLGALRR